MAFTPFAIVYRWIYPAVMREALLSGSLRLGVLALKNSLPEP